MGVFGRAQSKLDPVFARRAANDPRIREAEIAHESAMLDEHRALETRVLLRLARGSFCPDVWLPGAVPTRHHILDALVRHPRLLLVGGRWTGKTTLASFVLARTARWDIRFRDHVAFSVHVRGMTAPVLDEAQIVRANPAAGPDVLQMALECGRALLVVDGLDEAASPAALKQSIAELARRYPLCSMLVTTRPLPAKVPGRSESTIEGFLPVRMAGPDARRGATVHELDLVRSPAERVARLGDDVHRLLEAWSYERLPPGGGLRRLTERGRVLLATSIAAGTYDARMIEIAADQLAHDIREHHHEARWFEETGQLLHADENPRGGVPLPDPDELARAILDDIRRCPGVLFEKQPGIFAFAELPVQQYLAAMFFATEGVDTQLLVHRDDPWWHPVLLLAVGLPAPYSTRTPARAILRWLLDASVGADSATTFLAALAAQIAPTLPRALHDEIDRRMRSALPPRSNVQVAHLIDDIGDIAAPALVAALDTADANERAFLITALGRLDHPPSLRAIARYASDEETVREPVVCWFWNIDTIVVNEPVGFFAFTAIFNLAFSSAAANALFDQVLARVSFRTLEDFVRVVVTKLTRDDHWGVEPGPERDPDHTNDLMNRVILAYSRRTPK